MYAAEFIGCYIALSMHDGNPALEVQLYISPPHAYIQPQVDVPSLLQR